MLTKNEIEEATDMVERFERTRREVSDDKRKRIDDEYAERRALAEAVPVPPPDEESLSVIRKHIQKRSEELEKEREGFREIAAGAFEKEAMVAGDRRAMEEEWLLCDPVGSKWGKRAYPWPGHYYQGKILNPGASGHASASLKPLSANAQKNSHANWISMDFEVEATAADTTPKVTWDLNLACVMLTYIFQIPAQTITQTGVMDAIPVVNVLGYSFAQAFAGVYGDPAFSAEAEITETTFIVAEGGPVSAPGNRRIARARRRNGGVSKAVKVYSGFDPANGVSGAVVKGKPVRIYTFVELQCEAVGFCSGAGVHVEVEHEGIWFRLP